MRTGRSGRFGWGCIVAGFLGSFISLALMLALAIWAVLMSADKSSDSQLSTRSGRMPSRTPPYSSDKASTPEAGKRRTWADTTGRFSVEAELVGYENEAVQLKKANGNVIAVPVEKLSDGDRAFIEQSKKKKPSAVSTTSTTTDDRRVSRSTPKGDVAPSVTLTHSIEYKLAIVRSGKDLPLDDPSIQRFRLALDRLSSQYPENKQQIADISVEAVEILQGMGRRQDLLVLLESMQNVLPVKVNREYSEIVAVYLVARKKGMPHSEAVDGLRSLLRDLESMRK